MDTVFLKGIRCYFPPVMPKMVLGRPVSTWRSPDVRETSIAADRDMTSPNLKTKRQEIRVFRS